MEKGHRLAWVEQKLKLSNIRSVILVVQRDGNESVVLALV
jgi:hypothetical protein